MKLTTVGLAIALALPATSAFAEGTLNYSTTVARPVVRGVTILGPMAIRPRHISPKKSFAPIMRDPSGPTLGPLTISRGG
jgi:hypothetical protein